MLVNKGRWFLFTVDTVLQCPAAVDQNSHWGETHHAIVSTWILKGILAIFWLSTKCRPTIDRVLTNYWPIYWWSIDELSVKCRRKFGEVSVKYRWTKSYIDRDTSGTTYRSCLDRVSTDYRPSLDRLSNAISTECRPSVDRYIDRKIGRDYLQ